MEWSIINDEETTREELERLAQEIRELWNEGQITDMAELMKARAAYIELNRHYEHAFLSLRRRPKK